MTATATTAPTSNPLAEAMARRHSPARTRDQTPAAKLIAVIAALVAVVVPLLAAGRRLLMQAAGFGAIGYGAWLVAPWAGLMVGGVSVLLLDYLMTPPAEQGGTP